MTWEEWIDRFPLILSKQQMEAVRAKEGATLLLAVPGSGKTTVLVARIGYLIEVNGVAPENILTLTYTVSAARDMKERFLHLFGEEYADRLAFRTINGICARIILDYGRRIGRNPFELITDEKAISARLSGIFRDIEHEYATENDLKQIRTQITYIKNQMLSDEEIEALTGESDYRIAEIYRRYCAECRSRKQMDYDDQMIYALNILKREPALLEEYRRHYPWILVDEAQDTSRIQHEIIKLLAGNLFMVGDEDQSIYGFRAAYPEALLNFEKDHPGGHVLLMETNYRSTPQIVQMADRFIRQNELRHEKTMQADRRNGTEIRTVPLKGRRGQYRYLAKVASGLTDKSPLTAVLYRDNESALPLVDLFEKEGIPYRIRNMDLSFFTHRIVQDILCLLRLAENPMDTESFRQIYYKIGTYLNKELAEAICEDAIERQISVMDACVFRKGLPPGTRKACQNIRSVLVRMRSMAADAAIEAALSDLGYRTYLGRSGSVKSFSKIFILKTLAAGLSRPGDLEKRLTELKTILQEHENDAACRFVLSTIHSSKGLEYDEVYLMDVIDGIFPETVPKNKKLLSHRERETWEEERRLFYVGVTRARNQLNLFIPKEGSIFCSEFLGQEGTGRMPQKTSPAQTSGRGVTQAYGKTAGQGMTARAYGKMSGLGQTVKSSGKSLSSFGGSPQPKSKKEIVPEKTFEEFAAGLDVGLAVYHRKYGEGMITEMDDDRIVIRFGQEERSFVLSMLYQFNLLRER